MKALRDFSMTRMSGAGNTFIVINGLQNQLSEDFSSNQKRAEFTTRICRNYEGFNTDGLLILENHPDYDFKWDFYNSDGSSAEMCGNAARCAALYFFKKIKQKKIISFLTLAGEIQAEVLNDLDGLVKVRMLEMVNIQHDFTVELFNPTKTSEKVTGFFLNTGVPHFVLQMQPNFALAQALRNAKEFQPQGSNITFVDFDEEFIQAVSFERGVEDFTLACGTGAVAAATAHHYLFPNIDKQLVEMPGGLLTIEWVGRTPYLTGEADFHFDFSTYEEVL